MNNKNLLKVVKEGGLSVITKRIDGSYGLTFIESPVFDGLNVVNKVIIDELPNGTKLRRDLSHVAGLLFIEDGVASSNRIIEGGDAYLFVKRYVHQHISLYVKEGGEAAMRISRKIVNKINEEENRLNDFEKLTARTLIKCSKQIKSQERYNVLNLTLEEGKVVSKVPVSFGDNNISKIIGAEDTKVSTFVEGAKNVRTIKNFIKNLIYITVDKDVFRKIRNAKRVFLSRQKDELFLEDKKGFLSLKRNAYVEQGKNWIEIFAGCYTTTSMKKKMVLFSVKKDGFETWKDTIEVIIPGFYNLLVNASRRKVFNREQRRYTAAEDFFEISVKEAAKLFGRVSLGLTGSILLGELAGIAIAKTTFIPENAEEKSASDGAGFLVDEAAAELFNVTPGQARLLMLQARLREATCKAALQVRGKEAVYEYIEELRNDGVEVVVMGDENNIGALIDLNVVKIMDGKLFRNDFRFYNIAEVIKGNTSMQLDAKPIFAAACDGKEEEVENYLVESHCKELYDEVKEKLDTGAKEAKLGSKYSADVITQMNGNSPVTKKDKNREIQNGSKKRIAKLKFRLDDSFEFAALAPDLVASFTHGKCEILRHDDKVIEVFYGNYAAKVDRIKRHINMLQNEINEAKNLCQDVSEKEAKLKEMKLELIAVRKKYRTAVIYKYPTPNQIEYIKVVCLESDEMIERINKLNISDTKRKEFASAIKYYPAGALMLPNDTNIMDLLAGSDFDFDEGCLCFNRKLNKYLKFNKETIVLAKTNGEKQKPLILGRHTLEDVVLMQLQADDGVGKVTKEFERILMLLIDMINKGKYAGVAYKTALHYLFELVGSTKGEKRDYATPTNREFGQNFVNTILDEIKTVEWSFENVKKFLLDLTFCGRFYQESIIDATKTGEFFKRLISCLSIVLESSYEIAFDKEGKMHKIAPNKIADKKTFFAYSLNEKGETLYDTKRTISYVSYKDVFARIQDKLIEYYNNTILPMINDKFSEYFYSDRVVTAIQEAYDYIEANSHGDVIEKIKENLGVYNNMVGDKMRLIAEHGDDDDTRASINATYDVYVAAIANNIKEIFKEAEQKDDFFKDKANVGALLLGATIAKVYDSKKKVFTDFDAACGKTFANAVDLEAVVTLLGGGETYRTYANVLHDEGRIVPGTAVYLDRGIDGKAGIICESTYTGDAVYDVDSEGAYLYKEFKVSETVKNSDSKDIMITVDSRNILDGLTDEFFDITRKQKSKLLLSFEGYDDNGKAKQGVCITAITSNGKSVAQMKCKKVNGITSNSFFSGKNINDDTHIIKEVYTIKRESTTYYNFVVEFSKNQLI